MQLATLRHARKFKTVIVPVFPRYIFAILNVDTQRWRSINGTLGISRLIADGEKPIAVFSHIPILAACVFFDEEGTPKEMEWKVSDGDMHHDCKALMDVLAAHHVKLVVSGHIHLVDRVEYRGMPFVCDGAVSGNWWKGPRDGHPEGRRAGHELGHPRRRLALE